MHTFIFVREQLNLFSESIKLIIEKFEKYQSDWKQKEKETAELKEDLASLKEKFLQVDKTVDRQEQYSKRNCLLVQGVDEKYIKDMDQAIINIVKNDWDRKLSSMILIGHTVT